MSSISFVPPSPDDLRARLFAPIAALNTDYARAIDDDRLEAWPGFFVERCEYRITSADNHRANMPVGLMYADSSAMLRDRVAALREASVYERQAYRHVIGAPAILGIEGDTVLAEAPFLVARIMRDGRTTVFATGRYEDRIVNDAGVLRFRSRLVVCDSARIDTLLAIPL